MSTPTSRPSVPAQLVTEEQIDAAARSLARAFVDDPVWSWLVQDRMRDFATRAVGFFAAETRHYVHLGGAWTTPDCAGAALWAPPGQWKMGLRGIAGLVRPAIPLFGTRLFTALSALGQVDKVHPTEPHWYLGFVGTDPAHQGKGIGSTVLRQVLDRCDADGLPAYLESSKESNVPFYERHGFTVTSTHDFKGGPRMWLMWRDPVPPAT